MKVNSVRIGLIYIYDDRWVAGAYYIANLVHALSCLNDEAKPNLIILSYNEKGHEIIKEIEYPNIEFKSLSHKQGVFVRSINKLCRFFFKKNIFPVGYSNVDFAFVFPYFDADSLIRIKQRIYWIPDFQHHFLPQYFSQEEIELRNQQHALISKDEKATVVFSSEDASRHFKALYPLYYCKVYVLRFAVTHPSYSNISIDGLNMKFEISRKYFFSPNQFWAHKNHKVIIEALSLLKKRGKKEVLLVFSGKEADYRNPKHMEEIREMVERYEIKDMVRFLGFIDRADQLQLMKNSIAVVQPSLFEGWSTVVEDAKSMNQYVIASSLDVHKEQLKNNATFFDPNNAEELAGILEKFFNNPPAIQEVDYQQNKINFAEGFMKMIHEIESES